MRHGERFQTENDSEVAAGYLDLAHARGRQRSKQALERSLDDLDGFYTFVVGTRDGFAVLRDPIACKPAVMAETDDWVAFGTEYPRAAPTAGHRRRAHLGAGARHRLCLEPGAEHGAQGRPRRSRAARAQLRARSRAACRCARSTSCCTTPTAATS